MGHNVQYWVHFPQGICESETSWSNALIVGSRKEADELMVKYNSPFYEKITCARKYPDQSKWKATKRLEKWTQFSDACTTFDKEELYDEWRKKYVAVLLYDHDVVLY